MAVEPKPAPRIEPMAPPPSGKKTLVGVMGVAAAGLFVAGLNAWEGNESVGYRDVVGIATACRGVTGPDVVSIRKVCERFGKLFGVRPRFVGAEADTALISNAAFGIAKLGPLRVSTDTLIEWVADWLTRGGRLLSKPTHFESRDGKF